MDKKKIISTLILTQILLPYTPMALANNAASVLKQIGKGVSKVFKLIARSIIYNNRKYNFVISAEYFDGFAANGSTSDFSARLALANDKGETVYFIGQQAGDGNTTFEKISSSDTMVKYRGFFCSSSWTGCEAQDGAVQHGQKKAFVELVYHKVKNAWSLTAEIAEKDIDIWQRSDLSLKVSGGLSLKNKKLEVIIKK